MKVAFHSRLLTERGSEGAMLDYARLNRAVLGHESVIFLPARPEFRDHPLLQKWRGEFPVHFYQNKKDLGRLLEKENAEVLYLTKPGPFDRFLVPEVKNCIHAQFPCDEFHGDVYMFLSPWVSRVMTGRGESFVPFYVPTLRADPGLRKKLGIPREAKVFGRHGGWDTFNIPFVRREVARHARRHPQDHFVFLNTEPIRGTNRLKNIHYLPATVDPREKAEFLAACDAMLHARWHGETFGLAVGEFAVLGKPVLTYGGSREQAHLEMLGASARVYLNAEELQRRLEEFLPETVPVGEYGTYADPQKVMKIFQEKFLR